MTAEARGDGTWAYLAAGLTGISTYHALPEGLARGLLFAAVQLSGLVATAVGVRKNRPRSPAPWWTLFGGGTVCAAANVLWYPRFPTLAPVIYLAPYAVVASQVAMLMWRRARPDRTAVIDSSIVTVGLLGLSSVLLLGPYVHDPGLPVPLLLLSLAYLVIDVLVIGVVTLVVFTPSAPNRASWLLSLATVANLIADTSFVIAALSQNLPPRAPWISGRMMLYVLLGASALHPSMRRLSEPVATPVRVLSRPRLALVTTASLIVPTAGILVETVVPGFDATPLFALTAVLFILLFARVAGLMADVTERCRIEKTKDEFVTVVSHELRTPLTSIRGALGLLDSGALGELPEKGRRMLKIAAANTDRLVRLINDVLDIERMESGQATFQRRTCNAADLVNQAVDAMRSMADEAGLVLSACPRCVLLEADPDRVLQALINLINNAVRFSPPGSSVWVTNHRHGDDVVFQVRDQGRGIPPDKHEAIFERFEQVDASDARQRGGSGLGLSICRTIVNQHGGRIWVESSVGRGSTLSFTLPASPAVPQPLPAPARVSGKGPLILVCDADPDVLAVATRILTVGEFAVMPVNSAVQCLDAATEHQPAAIVLDLVMPALSGWDVIAALRNDRRTAHIPVIALTVLEETPAATRVSVNEWTTKPSDELARFSALTRASYHAPSANALVVENDLDLAHVLIGTLEQHGIAGFHVQDVHQAREIARRIRPDLVVLGLTYPDGAVELIDQLRRDEALRAVPLVLNTTKDLGGVERRELEFGPTHFFTKGSTPPPEFEHSLLALLQHLTTARVTAEARR